MANVKKITFKELVDETRKLPTPFEQRVKEIATLTHRSEYSVRMWYFGRRPDKLVIDVIAQHYNCDAKSLFK